VSSLGVGATLNQLCLHLRAARRVVVECSVADNLREQRRQWHVGIGGGGWNLTSGFWFYATAGMRTLSAWVHALRFEEGG
jgi:hypothetical protein